MRFLCAQLLQQFLMKPCIMAAILNFGGIFLFKIPAFKDSIICYIVIYNHAMFYTFLRTFTDSIPFKFNKICIEMWYWLPFWIFIIKIVPQRCQSGIQWIFTKNPLKNTKLQKNIISTLMHGSDPFLLDYIVKIKSALL